MFFAAPHERYEALRKAPELADLTEQPERELEAALTERFASRPYAYWADRFAGTSSAVVRLASLSATRDASLQTESGGDIDLEQATFRVIRHDRHPMGRWVDLVAPNAIRARHAPITFPAPMAKYGSHTRDVLRTLGYEPPAIDAMVASGAAGESWSKKYLPD